MDSTLCLLAFLYHSQPRKRDQKQDERESKCQDLLQKLTEQLDIVKGMKEDIVKIKSHVISTAAKDDAKL